MKVLKIFKNIALTLLFLAVLHLSVRYLGFVMSAADDDFGILHFAQTEKDSVDTVLIGSSHQFCSVDVNLLNHDYGHNSILLTSSSQPLRLSYYGLMYAVERQHPELVVLETCMTTPSDDKLTPIEKHYFLDNLPNWSRTKWVCVRDIGEEAYLYYYPLSSMHSYWSDVELKDFRLPEKLAEGQRYAYYFEETSPLEKWDIVPPEEKAAMSEPVLYWMDRIVALCEENDIELVLYTAPFVANEDAQKIYNGLSDYAAEHGIKYCNTMHLMDEIGIDPETDFLDEGHLNFRGQEKFTRYFAENILPQT